MQQNKASENTDDGISGKRAKPKTPVHVHNEVTRSINESPGISNHDLHEALTRAKLNDIIHLESGSRVDEKWQKVKSRRPHKTVVGNKSGNGECRLRAADSHSYWHLYRLHPDTTPEDVEAYLKNDFPGVLVEKLNSSNPTLYSSFKVTVRETDGPKILDAGLWPSGARINRFFLARPARSAQHRQ